MAELPDVLDALDLALARSEGVLHDDSVAEVRDTARRARARGGFLGEGIVVALAGGTGSGKSSLLNSLLGSPVVDTGILRPTTDRATAVYAPHGFADLDPLIEALAVDDVIVDEAAGRMIYVDLPDFDSTEEAHRHVVDRVLPRVDAVVWVLDPEKYSDPVLHRGFLERLVPYESQFVFVLNQIDRLGGEVPSAMSALSRLLKEDGYTDPEVVATAAAPLDGGDIRIDDLSTSLDVRLVAKTTALRKIAVDISVLANRQWAECRATDVKNLGEQSRDRVALAAATFVSLGVAAHELYGRMTMTEEG